MSDTCWVQALAVKGDQALVDAERIRITAARDQINYGQAWTQYFDWVLRVVFEAVPPMAILEKLKSEPAGEVRAMYETWLLAAWRNNPGQYGVAP